MTIDVESVGLEEESPIGGKQRPGYNVTTEWDEVSYLSVRVYQSQPHGSQDFFAKGKRKTGKSIKNELNDWISKKRKEKGLKEGSTSALSTLFTVIVASYHSLRSHPISRTHENHT